MPRMDSGQSRPVDALNVEGSSANLQISNVRPRARRNANERDDAHATRRYCAGTLALIVADRLEFCCNTQTCDLVRAVNDVQRRGSVVACGSVRGLCRAAGVAGC